MRLASRSHSCGHVCQRHRIVDKGNISHLLAHQCQVTELLSPHRHIKSFGPSISFDVDPCAWLLCLVWIADGMNHSAEKSLGWRIPLEVLACKTMDISILLCFLFWDIVGVSRHKDKSHKGSPGSKKSSEIRGRFVSFAQSVGHGLTFKVLADDSHCVICRSWLLIIS